MADRFLPFPEPVLTDAVDGSTQYVLGVEWDTATPESWTGVRWRVPNVLSAVNHYICAFLPDAPLSSGGVLLQSKLVSPVAGANQTFYFDTPITAVAGTRYIAAVLTNHYVHTGTQVWPFGDGAGLNGRTARSTITPANTFTFPNGMPASTNYHVSPILTVGGAQKSAFLAFF